MKKNIKIISRILIFMIISSGYYFLNQKFGFSIPCVFHVITNLYCPGCGITRMLFSMLEFNFYQAFRFNPFVFSLILLYVLYLMLKVIKRKEISIPKWVYYVLLIVAIFFGILRNIELFSWLEPTLI